MQSKNKGMDTVLKELSNALERFQYGTPSVHLLAPNQIVITHIVPNSTRMCDKIITKAKSILEKFTFNYLLLERNSGGYVIVIYETLEEEYDARMIELALLMEKELPLQTQVLELKKQMLEVTNYLLQLKNQKDKQCQN
jgi:hypothetical protein